MRTPGYGGWVVAVGCMLGCATSSRATTTTTAVPVTAPASTAAQTPVAAEAEAPVTLAEALEDVRAYDHRARAAASDEAREPMLLDAVRRWSRWSQAMITASRRDESDRLFATIAAVNTAHREAGFEARPRGIQREVFRAGDHRVEGWEYAEAVRYYPQTDRVLRWVTFNVMDEGERVARIDLEYSNITGPYFVLAGASAQGHSQFVPYGPNHPDYWTVRAEAIRVLGGEVEAIVGSAPNGRPTTGDRVMPSSPGDAPRNPPSRPQRQPD